MNKLIVAAAAISGPVGWLLGHWLGSRREIRELHDIRVKGVVRLPN